MKIILTFVTLFLFINGAYAADSGESVYSNNCSLCHGPNGAGDGPVGKALKPNPANYEDLFNKPKAYKSAADLKKHILDILEKGKPKTAMPAFKNIPQKDREAVADYLIKKHYHGH